MYICILQSNLTGTTLHSRLILYAYINISKGRVLYKNGVLYLHQ
jgi:hypothetical protein